MPLDEPSSLPHASPAAAERESVEELGPSSAARPSRGAEEVVFDAPGFRLVASSERAIGILSTSVRPEWSPRLADGFHRAADLQGGAVPWIIVCRLDKRYPIQLGFDRDIAGMRARAQRLKGVLGAMSLVLQFGGVLRTTMNFAMRAIQLGMGTTPMRTHDTIPEAQLAIEPLRPRVDDPIARRRADLLSFQRLAEALDIDLSRH